MLCLAAICLLIAAVTGRTTGAIGAGASSEFQAAPAPASGAPAQPAAQKPATEKPATEKPPAETPAAQPAGPLPAGYAGSDTCELCHEPQVASLKGTAHGQAAHPRSPAAGPRL